MGIQFGLITNNSFTKRAISSANGAIAGAALTGYEAWADSRLELVAMAHPSRFASGWTERQDDGLPIEQYGLPGAARRAAALTALLLSIASGPDWRGGHNATGAI